MFKGFKKFISRGNMIDMAVGVVMGAAVTSVVNSLVKNLINPLVAAIFGKPDLDNVLKFTLNHNAVISIGAILGSLLNFLLIAIAVYFCILVPINKFRDMSEKLFKKQDDADKEKEISTDQQTVDLLKEISDELKDIKANNADADPIAPKTES